MRGGQENDEDQGYARPEETPEGKMQVVREDGLGHRRLQWQAPSAWAAVVAPSAMAAGLSPA